LVRSAAVASGARADGLDTLQEISRRNRGCAATPELVSATVLRAAFFETALKNGSVDSSADGLGIFKAHDREVAIGRCQLQAAPGAVKEVLATEPESDVEAVAIDRLLAETKGCGTVIVAKGSATVWRLALLEAASHSPVTN
jgi:hypothetical protein